MQNLLIAITRDSTERCSLKCSEGESTRRGFLYVCAVSRPQARGSTVQITELDGDSEGEEDRASAYMQLADMQMAPRNMQDDFNSILSNLVSFLHFQMDHKV